MANGVKDGKEDAVKEGNGDEIKAETPGKSAAQEQGKSADDEREEKERFLRLAAEFDNYKRRVAGEIANAKGVGKAETLKNLLPILDEFELAMIAINKSENSELAKGIELVYSNLVEFMKREGVKEVKCDGIFDPYMHEIALTRESGKKPGTILEVIKKGYTMNGILLRTAMVIVAGEGKKEDSESAK
jgi:molecular chaperone GrpE